MIKLLSFLKKQAADNCVILTFNADLPFFEYTIFEPLYANGCRNTLVICDPTQYDLALKDSSLLRYAGQRYLVLPARVSPKAFHPKLIFLTGKESGHVLITSSNLTKAGYAINWEVTTHFEFNQRKPDPAAWNACNWASTAIKKILEASDTTGLGVQRLDQLLGTTPWLRRESDIVTDEPIHTIHNLDIPIFRQVVDQYRTFDASPVREALVISPFFDRRASAFSELLSKLSPEIIKLYTQDPKGLNPRTLKSTLARHKVAFQAYQLTANGRRLHAKALMLRTDHGVWLITGSANFSEPALLQTALEGNTEMVALRFEPDTKYFDAWMNELTADTFPLDIELIAGDDIDQDKTLEEKYPIQLLSAVLDAPRLTLSLDASPLTTGVLKLCLGGTTELEYTFEHWKLNLGNKITLHLADFPIIDLNSPTLVSIVIEGANGQALYSSKVLLHNLRALERFSRPVEHKPRPNVPEGMVPESYEQCAEILDMLHELLATNKEKLDKHQKRIRQRDKEKDNEQKMAVEADGEYIPDDHFVDEEIRRPVASAGNELYADYYDRLTYEGILRAALSAVYRSNAPDDISTTPPLIIPKPKSDRPVEGDTDGDGKAQPAKRPSKGEKTVEEKIRARIETGFRRLVGNFVKGLQDDEYLDQVPIRYLLELSLIILSYMRVVYRDEILSDGTFLRLSLELYQSLWGWRGKPGAWAKVGSRLADVEKSYVEEQMAFSAQIWFHAYIVAERLENNNDRRLYDLAAWMREYSTLSARPDILTHLPSYTYKNIWNASMSGLDQLNSSQVVERLKQYSQFYDHISLETEVAGKADAKVSISFDENIAGLNRVPALKVKMPLSDEDLNYCFNVFIKFFNWPNPKHHAWAQFVNANPPIEADDINRIVIFYQGDQQTFTFAVERATQRDYRPNIYRSEITGAELNNVADIRDLE